MIEISIGIDNGVTGTIGIITNEESFMFKTPVKRELSYTKTKKYINRIDVNELKQRLNIYADKQCMVYIERPFVNPGMFKSTLSAIRALEATLIVLEELKLPYQYIDSKEWQKALLPSGLKGKELKKASLDIGRRLFPHIEVKHPDYDGMLIAEYVRRKNTGVI